MDEIAELKRRVAALEQWKEQKERKQISFPLDQESIEVLNRHYMHIDDDVVITFIGAAAHYKPLLFGKQDGKAFNLYSDFVRYTADPASDVLTIVDKTSINRFADSQEIYFYTDLLTGDTAPGGITAGTTSYFVRDAAADGYSFKIAATDGGAAINITSAGVGKQFISRA